MTQATSSFAEDLLLGTLILLFGASFTVLGTRTAPDWQRADFWQSASFDDLIGATTIVAGCGIVLWWLISILSAVVAALLFVCGKRSLANRFASLAPGFMKRLVVALLGLNLTAAPLAYAGQAPLQNQDSAGQESASPAYRGVDPAWKIKKTTPPHATVPQSSADRAARVVEAGESLWSIAAGVLGSGASASNIATEWPRWYAQNRETIGSDPDRLLAGVLLQEPDRS